jgi:hypothetical protein
MQHKEPAYVRKGKTIRNVADGKVETFKSIGEAKRRSLKLQLGNGGRGAGYVRVES